MPTAQPSYRPRLKPLSAEEQTDPDVRRCDVPGCPNAGLYRAPRSPKSLRDYYWFCLDHVREYNKNWNFFSGMDDSQVEESMRADSVWGRGTRPMGGWRAAEDRLRDTARQAFDEDTRWESASARRKRYEREEEGQANSYRPNAEIADALAHLNLDGLIPGVDLEFDTVRARYIQLVKKFHPDHNAGDKAAEEKLKSINQAFAVLKAAFALKSDG